MVLMENAGRGIAEEVVRWIGGSEVAVLCGVGNNGGDGLVAARHLLNAGKKVKVFLVGKTSKLKTDPKINLSILDKMGCDIIRSEGAEKFILRFPSLIRKADLIIDAIFGIGLKSGVKEPYAEIIRCLNQSKKPVLAVDVPSGLNADTGEVLGVAVKARRTVTFVAAKKGFRKARRYCGKVVVKDIGIT